MSAVAEIKSFQVQRVPAPAPHEPAPLSGTPEQRIVDRGFDLLRHLIATPQAAERFPTGATVVIVPLDDPEVARINLALGRRAAREGKDVVYTFVGPDGPITGTAHQFLLDLRDERWSTEPRTELSGMTAAQARALLEEIASESHEHGPAGFGYDNIVVLNGVRVYILDEPEPGLYQVVAVERDPRT
jgi:hypothetical protein